MVGFQTRRYRVPQAAAVLALLELRVPSSWLAGAPKTRCCMLLVHYFWKLLCLQLDVRGERRAILHG